MSFNTQPPEGGWAVFWGSDVPSTSVSTHSRPKAAGRFYERCWLMGSPAAFQHTAARRRLVGFGSYFCLYGLVSTHSRPKAAGIRTCRKGLYTACFNTQPPEGGWLLRVRTLFRRMLCFNTQPPEGGWEIRSAYYTYPQWFQHTAARRRLGR